MSPEEKEFRQLAERYVKSREYVKKLYDHDTPDGKAWAEKTFEEILKRMNELWNMMKKDERQRCIGLFGLEAVMK